MAIECLRLCLAGQLSRAEPNRKPTGRLLGTHDKKTIITRPLPNSAFNSFGHDITQHTWDEVLITSDVNVKVDNFHQTLRTKLDTHFPTKTVKISTLDKKWFSPSSKDISGNKVIRF
jgi:hypothetical protein